MTNPADIKKLALELLKSGTSKTEIAKRLGVNRATVARWEKESPTIKIVLTSESPTEFPTPPPPPPPQQTTFEVPNHLENDFGSKLTSIQARIKDLLIYQNNQRELGSLSASLATAVYGVCHAMVEKLQIQPEELSPRMLPQFIKAASDLAKVSSEAMERAVRADSMIRDEIANEFKASRTGIYQALNEENDRNLRIIASRHYPIDEEAINEAINREVESRKNNPVLDLIQNLSS